MIEVPLTNNPSQIFSITLFGTTYDIRVILNSRSEQWTISFAVSGVMVVSGIALTGGIDILKPYNLPFDNAYVVNLDNPSLDPTEDNLGTVSKLFILTDEEIASAASV